MMTYIWQHKGWPDFSWRSDELLNPLSCARKTQGHLLAHVKTLKLEYRADVLVNEAHTTSAIEGVRLETDVIRSSVARRLGLPRAGLPNTTRPVDGLVDMLIDATSNPSSPLTPTRLMGWQASLFPTGYSGLTEITAGAWRKGPNPMRVVSGPAGKERIHYEAPPADQVDKEMKTFLHWWNSPPVHLDGLLRAGIAHLWFLSIHPFEDGNGRVARALTDMALAADEELEFRPYSMSARIVKERDRYYEVLERAQKGSGDITEWLIWFLQCLEMAVKQSEDEVQRAFRQSQFWEACASINLNERQRKVLKRLLEAGPNGFEGGMTTRKYRGMTGVSRETAKRDLADLVAKNLLIQNPGKGRSVSYRLLWPE